MKSSMTIEEYRLQDKKKGGRRNKYNAVKIVLDGHVFDSKHEAHVYQTQMHRLRSGELKSVSAHVRYPLHAVNALGEVKIIGHYVADIVTVSIRDYIEIIDAKCKATMTSTYRLKKRIFEHQYGLKIKEVFK